MGRVAKAIEDKKKAALLEDTPRPIRVHYAGGMRISACATLENAAERAFSHVLRGHASNAQVVRIDNKDAFRVTWTASGIHIWSPPEAYARPTKIITPAQLAEKEAAAASKARPKLSRVK